MSLRSRRIVRRTLPTALVLVALAAPGSERLARAQERATDVGGQPAKRRVTKYPKLTVFVPAAVPKDGEAALPVSVFLTIAISETGAVNDVTVAKSGGAAFDEAAIAAARRFSFEPAEVDGKPAPAKITYRYDFVVTKEEPPAPPPVPMARVQGRVLSLRSGRPVARARVTVLDLGLEATTDAEGAFAFAPMAAGPHTFEVGVPGAPPVRFEEAAEADKKTTLRFDVDTPSSRDGGKPPGDAPVEEVEVRGRPRARRESVQMSVRAEQAKKVAGTQGDVLKVVQNLPGVSRPPVASGQIVVWGAAPKETRTFVDGVEIPALYHGSGLRGTVNSDLVSSIDLVPGAFSAEYGRGLGGLVRVETRNLPRGTHGYVGADTLDGSAYVSTELGERARVGVAVRQSWLDRLLAATSAPDVGDFFPIPRYADGQVKATVDLRKREAVDVVLLGSLDDLDRTVPSADPAKTRRESSHTGFWRAYARYTSVSEGGDTTTLTPFFGQDRTSLDQRFGGTAARVATDSDRYGIRGSLRTRVSGAIGITTGLDALGTSTRVSRRGSLTLPPREGDVAVFGQPPSDEFAADDWNTHVLDMAPNVTADVRLGPVTVSPGLRFDAYLVEGSRKTPRVGLTPGLGFSRLETALAPRVAARWDVHRRLALHAAAGTYHQPPEPEDLSAVFGTPDLALSRATHVSVGENLRITDSLALEVTGFHKTMKDLVVRSRSANPLLARALTQNGEGKSYGLQFLLRQELWKGFFGWVSYAITRSERRFEGDLDYRAFDFDQPHVLSVVGSWEIGKWGFGARFRYASGNPRTPVTAGVYDALRDRYDPAFGPQNSIRIPAFYQLDLRVERTLHVSEAVKVLLFADVQNVTARQNAEEIVYSSDYRRRDTIKGLPTLAVVGARVEW